MKFGASLQVSHLPFLQPISCINHHNPLAAEAEVSMHVHVYTVQTCLLPSTCNVGGCGGMSIQLLNLTTCYLWHTGLGTLGMVGGGGGGGRKGGSMHPQVLLKKKIFKLISYHLEIPNLLLQVSAFTVWTPVVITKCFSV